jgi:hypothetical protein
VRVRCKKILLVLNKGAVELRSLPTDYQVEIIRLDAIACDPVSAFLNLSAEGKEFVADEHPYLLELETNIPASECGNCGRDWSQPYLKEVKDLLLRVEPSEPMPSGECPICGALCHPIRQ